MQRGFLEFTENFRGVHLHSKLTLFTIDSDLAQAEMYIQVEIIFETCNYFLSTSSLSNREARPHEQITSYTGDFFEEWNEITPQIHIRKFEEQTA